MIVRLLFAISLALLLAGCGGAEPAASADHHDDSAEAEEERGPHRGRMLRDGDFALEIAIVENNAPPQYQLYAYLDNKPVKPEEVDAVVEVVRLDGEVGRFTFKPESDYLVASGSVREPHSFDVTVNATHAGMPHQWAFEAHEGRTTLPADVARDAGVEVAVAGPALIRDTAQLVGTITLDASRHAQIKARFPGIVRAVNVQQGDRVRRGQALVVIEGNESMRRYSLTAPFDGVVLSRNTNIGDVASDNSLVELADLSKVWVEVQAIGKDANRLVAGQRMRVQAATGDVEDETVIDALLPLATRGQSVVARASLPNPDGRWRPGMTVTADVVISEREVPLAVKETGLQRYRDFTVVFEQVGETYEVRMLELGARDGEHTEVLDGIKSGARYVTEQSFLIKADTEKSGASHDH